MSILVAIDHRTEYRYDRLVAIAPHTVRLRPAPHCRTPIRSYSLRIEPERHFINWQQDPFGNYLARLVFPEKAKTLQVQVDVIAEMITIDPFDFFVDDYASQYPFGYDRQLAQELSPYLEVKEHDRRLLTWLDGIDRSPRDVIDFLVELNRRLQQDIAYEVRMEPGIRSCEETLRLGQGSCRDSGWLLVQILRHLGLAARFVSGYLVQLTADVQALEGPSGPQRDFTDLHAWAEVYLPGAGWLGLDPTSGLFAGEGHIPLVCTPNPVSAAPITGTTEPCNVSFYFHNRLKRIHEDPRVTKPYSEAHWQRIESLGEAIDRELQEQDVRLTMGGAPTFVSIDDRDGDEWNVDALGPTKKGLAADLLGRLQRRFAPGGLLHVGQGEWHPGEPLPRWALICYWRADGEPVWRDATRLGSERDGHACGAEDAERFIRRLATRLGIEPGRAQPAYEDALYYLWKEARLPADVDPLDSKLNDPKGRARMARIFSQGLERVIGYALPLRWDGPAPGGGWISGSWRLRRGHLFLVPGESPMGYRLPLDALGSRGPSYSEAATEDDRTATEQPGRPADCPPEPIRTALCIEPRDGRLYCFLPPLTQLEHWLELVAAVEATAAETGAPIIIEGHEPPADVRLRKLTVAPEPGVIKVNLHPAESWRELEHATTILYEEARLARLGTEKFMRDGRHTGTGGGNHVALGGSTPADSPLLRRPDLLQSLITYWQHHPSLSYLFSGACVGPHSQAPRVDEAREDHLHELAIAFQQMPAGQATQPEIIDRLLRNLLVDITGDTERTEFCIDKLYSPDTAGGRQGLVELRAFEMPPHARMGLAQMLLLRALVARFWKEPYRRAPVRWGTELHDRFLLPHYVRQDFEEVICELNRAGYPFELAWFDPFYELRFPRYGDLTTGNGIHMELRGAIEPWRVLGQEVTGTGTARFVDASVERMQVAVDGMTDARHVLACNGRRVPLRPTGRKGEYVAGIRFKAWNRPSGPHPMIPVHDPLVFDIVDLWNRASLGGCTYYVSHPGRRAEDRLPVNSYEAESRRTARFRRMGHTPGDIDPPPEEPAAEHPYTLDLLWTAGCI